MSAFHAKSSFLLLPSDLLSFKCVVYAYMGVCVCVRVHIIVVNQISSKPLNLKFRLRLLSELIYMPLMSPPRCAFRPEAETTSLFSKSRETRSSKGLSVF